MPTDTTNKRFGPGRVVCRTRHGPSFKGYGQLTDLRTKARWSRTRPRICCTHWWQRGRRLGEVAGVARQFPSAAPFLICNARADRQRVGAQRIPLPDCRPTKRVSAIYGRGLRGSTINVRGTAMRIDCRRRAIYLALLATFVWIGSATSVPAGSAAQIDAAVEATLRQFFWRVRGSRELVAKSAAVLGVSDCHQSRDGHRRRVRRGGAPHARSDARVLQHRIGLDWISTGCSSTISHHCVHDAGSARRLPTRGWLEGWRGRVGGHRHRGGRRFGRHE